MTVAPGLEGAIRVSFSCGVEQGITLCARCGRHEVCRGENVASLICLACFDALDHEWPDYGRGDAA
jgi:hypothetical protein